MPRGNSWPSAIPRISASRCTVTLSAGDYYIGVLSPADPNQLGFYDMGSYFLYGSIVPVPEPSSWTLLVCGSVAGPRGETGPRERAVIALIRSRLAAFGFGWLLIRARLATPY